MDPMSMRFQQLDPVSPNPIAFSVTGDCSLCGCVCACYCGGDDHSAVGDKDNNFTIQSSNQTVIIAQTMFGTCS